MRAPAWIAVALAAAAAGACGSSSSDDRVTRTTPGADETPQRATPTPEAEPPAEPERVSRTEVSVIRGWSDTLRHGRVKAAAAYFTPPVYVFTGTQAARLLDRAAVETFNRGLPCGSRLTATQRSAEEGVIATFVLTERPGPGRCDPGLGDKAAVRFVIRRRHIVHWERVGVPQAPPVPDDSRIS
jgi:hypothetical protein